MDTTVGWLMGISGEYEQLCCTATFASTFVYNGGVLHNANGHALGTAEHVGAPRDQNLEMLGAAAS
jgi:hypothetical protein